MNYVDGNEEQKELTVCGTINPLHKTQTSPILGYDHHWILQK